MIIRLNQDLIAGILLFLFGALFSIGAYWHSIGTLDEMGPGYFPLIAGCMLLGIGAILVAAGAMRHDGTVAELHVRPISAIVVGLCIYALITPYAGLSIGILVLVAMASLASAESRPVEVVSAGIVLGLFSVLLFVKGLGIPMPLLPTLSPR